MPGLAAPPVFRPDKRPPLGGRRPFAPAIGGRAVGPLLIPYSWLQPPVVSRTDKPYTTATVAQHDGTTATDQNAASLAEYGDLNFAATLYTATDADTANLASWMLAYYATQPGEVPRTRFSRLAICLSKRTVAQQLFLHENCLIGRHIQITDPPITWPQGAAHQVIEGVHNVVSQLRMLNLLTSPLVGADPGVAGPWFRYGTSSWGGTDAIVF